MIKHEIDEEHNVRFIKWYCKYCHEVFSHYVGIDDDILEHGGSCVMCLNTIDGKTA